VTLADARLRARPTSRAGSDAASVVLRRSAQMLIAIVILSFGAAPWLGFTRSLGLITLAGYAAALAGIFFPAAGLLGIGVLCVLDAPARIYLLTGGLFRYNTLNYILLFALLLTASSVLQFRDIHTKLLLLIVALLVSELLITPELAFGIQHAFNVVSLLGLLACFERGAIDRVTWVWLGIVCGITGAAGGLAYNLQQAVLPFANPNALAYFPLGAMFAICLGFRFADDQGRLQLGLATLAGINGLWVFLTASRGSLLVASLCILFLLYSTPSMGRRALALGTLLVVGVLVSSHFGNLQEYAIHRLDALVDPTRTLSSRTSGRSDLVLGGWYIFQAHPFGVGTGGFASAWADLGHREGLSGFQEGVRFQAHAGWIKILAENGIPGFLLLVAFVLSFAVVGLQRPDSRLRLLGLFTAIVLTTAWISTEFQAKGLWLLVAGAITLLRPRQPELPSRPVVVVPRRRPRARPVR
jgi:O-antigen ligase